MKSSGGSHLAETAAILRTLSTERRHFQMVKSLMKYTVKETASLTELQLLTRFGSKFPDTIWCKY